MTRYKVILRADVVRYVDADTEDEALEKVDYSDMNYELNYSHGGGHLFAVEVKE